MHALCGVQLIQLGWWEHILCLMYRQSKMSHLLDTSKAYVELRSNKSFTFKMGKNRTYDLYLKSPFSRCLKIWEMLKLDVQRATTKLKLMMLIKQMCRPY